MFLMVGSTSLFLALVVFLTSWPLVDSRSQPSVLQSLARGGLRARRRLSNTEAAKSLYESWYPDLYTRRTVGVIPGVHGDSETYGELEPEGIERIIERIGASGAPLSENDVFADLGSGVGQVALMVFLQAFPGRVVGIELLPERHEFAVRAREQVLKGLDRLGIKGKEAELTFFNGDIRDNSHWAGATVVFSCSTLFSKELIAELREELVATLKPGAMVFSLQPLGGNHKDLAPVDVIDAEVSWQPKTKVYIYIRNLDPLKLKELNSAITGSRSVSEDCISWGQQSGYFATDELLQRFCKAFAWKWDERAQYGQRRVDYDWVLSEL